MAAVAPNFEEASNVATEFIYGIDNLPNEVSHILQEIKHREARTAELQQEIDRDGARYIRHSRRASSASTLMPMTTMSAPSGKSSTPVPDSPSSRAESVTPGSGNPVPIPAKISASYTEIHELAAEKVALAEKLIELITRTRAKLDVDISKVRLLQGEPPELVATQASASMNLKPAGLMALAGMTSGSVGLSGNVVGAVESFGAPGRNPALAISESLRNALAQPLVEGKGSISTSTSSGASPAASAHANKKRKTTTTTSIKITPASSPAKHRSASPASVTPAHGYTQQKSRLSRQVHPPPVEEDEEDMDVDGEGDEDEGEVEDDNDETLYCFCRKQSYGDMIACDNEGGCPYEWFHLACVGLKQPPAEKWYCSVCAKDKGITPGTTTSSRKGRKK